MAVWAGGQMEGWRSGGIKRYGIAETSISPGVGFEFQKTGAISSYSLCFLFMNEDASS